MSSTNIRKDCIKINQCGGVTFNNRVPVFENANRRIKGSGSSTVKPGLGGTFEKSRKKPFHAKMPSSTIQTITPKILRIKIFCLCFLANAAFRNTDCSPLKRNNRQLIASRKISHDGSGMAELKLLFIKRKDNTSVNSGEAVFLIFSKTLGFLRCQK